MSSCSPDDVLLDGRHLRDPHLDSQIAARHHDDVAGEQDFIQVVDRLRAFYLCDQQRIAARVPYQPAGLLDIGRISWERHRKIVDPELGCGPDIFTILGREGASRQTTTLPVDTLAVR